MSTITIGLDVGDRWSEVCVLDARGTVRSTRRVRTTTPALELPHPAELADADGGRANRCAGAPDRGAGKGI